jgi:phosphoserine phosphatase
MGDAILIHFSGHDKPGLTASLTQLLADHSVCVLDIGQAVVHEVLALGMLIEVPESNQAVSLRDALEKKCGELDLHVRFTTVSAQALDHWRTWQNADRFLVTLLGRAITAQHLWRVTAVIAENSLNIDSMERLSTPLSLACSTAASHIANANACVELRISGNAQTHPEAEARMRAALLLIAQEEEVDIAFQRESIFRRNRRLFAFDMDSTLIQGEVIDELARMAGVADKVVAITAAAMRGEIEFQESFRRRVALLKGLPADRVYSLLDKIPLVEGADRLTRTLKLLGYKTAILSGGFHFFGDHLQKRLSIDYIYANDLDIEDGLVTGLVKTPIVDGPRKASLLQEIADREKISLEQVVAVGDGANDLPMLKLAGMGIAFHAKPLVRQSADHALSYLGLDCLLYLIGVRDRDLEIILS